mgnify:CR=1 FL=1
MKLKNFENFNESSSSEIGYTRKDASELEDCEEGKFVILYFFNGEVYKGIFRGFDDDDIMLKTKYIGDKMRTIGLPYNMLKNYDEQD